VAFCVLLSSIEPDERHSNIGKRPQVIHVVYESDLRPNS
jgi:hypothetical protein